MFRRSRICFAVAGAVLIALALGATNAKASPDTMRLALEDLVVGSADLAASPFTAGVATARTAADASDNGFLQALYAGPGWVGLTVLQAGQAAFRIAVGALELVPGVLLFPIPGVDVPESWNVFRRGDPLYEFQNPLEENPSWMAWVPPITPFTMDVRFAPVSPLAPVAASKEPWAGSGDTAMTSSEGASE